MWQHGHFYWNELMTRDPEAAKAFYGGTVGWQFEGMAMESGAYWVCKDGDRPVGGIFDMSGPDFEGLPPHWFAYLAVDAVDARVAKATAASATLL
ncbi:MAG: VOC family protein, partial [Geminicoccaceae bacterium]